MFSPLISSVRLFRLRGKFLDYRACPKTIDCALMRTVLGQALAVFQAFSLEKPRILRLLSQN
jgi:hypothetical protein